METLGTALLADEIPAGRAVTVLIPRVEMAEALQVADRSPELYLDIVRGDEQSTIGIGFPHEELERLLARARGEDILLAFDRDELEWAVDDVEAHGLREKALVFAVVAAGAIGSGATIANAAPTIGDNPGAASVATVQNLAAQSIVTDGGVASNVHTPGLQTGDEGSAASAAAIKLSTEPRAAVADDGVASNVHTPGVQIGPGESAAGGAETMATAASVKLSTEPSPAVAAADDGVASNVHTPGMQIGPGEAAVATPSNVSAARVADDAVASNVHTPGLQVGPGESTAGTRSVQVSTNTSSGEFLGIDTRDATDALIAGGVLLAIAGATFAGTRRPGSARPA